MRQSFVRPGVVQTQLAIHRSAYRCFAPLWMLDQRAAFDALRERPSIGFALAPFLWPQAMQLPMMPVERSNTDQPPIIRGRPPAHPAIGQHPGIDGMRLPDFS
ncbi:MAG: hypothetical protein ACXWOX_09675 [Ktedonobacteraceae bacterium]